MKNAEGYPNPTAGKAIHRAGRIPGAIWEVIRIGREYDSMMCTMCCRGLQDYPLG